MRPWVTAILLALALLCGAAGCTPAPAKTAAGAEVSPEIGAIYAAASKTLDAIDQFEEERMKGWTKPGTDEELAAAEARIEKLELARDALDLIEQKLDNHEDISRKELADAVALLRNAASAFGADLPHDAATLLAGLEELLRGAP